MASHWVRYFALGSFFRDFSNRGVNKPTVIIALDTDFVIKLTNDPLPKLDRAVLEDNELVCLPEVVAELKGLAAATSYTVAKRAKNALRQMKESEARIKITVMNDSPTLRRGEEADKKLVEFISADPAERMIATLDRELLSKLERTRLPYLTLRNGRAFLGGSNLFNRQRPNKRR